MFQDLTQHQMPFELVWDRASRALRAQLPAFLLAVAVVGLFAIPAARPLAAFLTAVGTGCAISYFILSER